MRVVGTFLNPEPHLFDVKVTTLIPGHPGGETYQSIITANDKPLTWREACKWVEGVLRQSLRDSHVTDVNIEYFGLTRPWTPELRSMYLNELLRSQAEASAPAEPEDEIIYPRVVPAAQWVKEGR